MQLHLVFAATDWRPWAFVTVPLALLVGAAVLAVLKARAWRFAVAAMAGSALLVLVALGNDHPDWDWASILLPILGTGGAFMLWSMMVEWRRGERTRGRRN